MALDNQDIKSEISDEIKDKIANSLHELAPVIAEIVCKRFKTDNIFSCLFKNSKIDDNTFPHKSIIEYSAFLTFLKDKTLKRKNMDDNNVCKEIYNLTSKKFCKKNPNQSYTTIECCSGTYFIMGKDLDTNPNWMAFKQYCEPLSDITITDSVLSLPNLSANYNFIETIPHYESKIEYDVWLRTKTNPNLNLVWNLAMQRYNKKELCINNEWPMATVNNTTFAYGKTTVKNSPYFEKSEKWAHLASFFENLPEKTNVKLITNKLDKLAIQKKPEKKVVVVKKTKKPEKSRTPSPESEAESKTSRSSSVESNKSNTSAISNASMASHISDTSIPIQDSDINESDVENAIETTINTNYSLPSNLTPLKKRSKTIKKLPKLAKDKQAIYDDIANLNLTKANLFRITSARGLANSKVNSILNELLSNEYVYEDEHDKLRITER